MEPSWNLPDIFTGLAELGSRPPGAAGDASEHGGAFSVSGRNVKGGGAVLMRIGPLAQGVTQLLELQVDADDAVGRDVDVGMGVLRIE